MNSIDPHVLAIDDLNFESEVLGASQPFLLDFSAEWCAPCRAIAPIMAQLASENAGRLKVGTVDIDAAPLVASRFNVRGAPTLILFRDGREAARMLGATTKARLVRQLGLADEVRA